MKNYAHLQTQSKFSLYTCICFLISASLTLFDEKVKRPPDLEPDALDRADLVCLDIVVLLSQSWVNDF